MMRAPAIATAALQIATSVLLIATSAGAQSATLSAAGGEPAAGCDTRLAQTLVAMEARPLLKEEHATALMWLRLDAAKAAAAGDEVSCLAHVAVVELLLGLSAANE